MAKVKALSEAKLIQMLIELTLLPFGYSRRELLAANPAGDRGKAVWGVASEGEDRRQPLESGSAGYKEDAFRLGCEARSEDEAKPAKSWKKAKVKESGGMKPPLAPQRVYIARISLRPARIRRSS